MTRPLKMFQRGAIVEAAADTAHIGREEDGVRKLLGRLAISVFALVIIGDAGLLAGTWVTREPVPQPLNAQRIFTASRPAVVLVHSNVDITSSVPRPVASKAKQDLSTQ